MSIWVLLFLLLNFFYFFFEMPVLALGFTDWSLPMAAWGMVLLFVPLIAMIDNFRQDIAGTVWGDLLQRFFPWLFQGRLRVVNITDSQKYGWILKRYKAVALTGAAFVVIGFLNMFVFPFFVSSPILYSQSFHNLLGEVKESSFTADIEPINLSQIRIVDEETAKKLAEKKIGEVPALGSEVQLGQLVLQKVKDKLYYVAPLEHQGIFQWLSNHSQGSRGYVMISATNPQDVRLVQKVHDTDIYIKYQTRGYIMDYLPRYIYAHGIVNVGMTDFSFEVDDDLNPYWVVTLYKNKIGYLGHDAVGAVLVNAQTGELQRYSMEDLPKWVDRIQPEAFIYSQIRDWGEYVNGFWNSILAKTGTLKPTGNELHLIYGNDDNVYWYTGITSYGKDESTVGFITVNSRTKEAKWYKFAGANEAGAVKSSEGQVQEKNYRAGYPILYNINGVPTYIAPLKDKEGLLKSVAFISVENYNLVGVGADIESALRVYRQNLSSKGNLFVPGNDNKQVTLQGRISRVSNVVKSGESYFYFMLEGDPRIFVGTANTAPKLPLAQVGDTVVITVTESKDVTNSVTDFQGQSY